MALTLTEPTAKNDCQPPSATVCLLDNFLFFHLLTFHTVFVMWIYILYSVTFVFLFAHLFHLLWFSKKNFFLLYWHCHFTLQWSEEGHISIFYLDGTVFYSRKVYHLCLSVCRVDLQFAHSLSLRSTTINCLQIVCRYYLVFFCLAATMTVSKFIFLFFTLTYFQCTVCRLDTQKKVHLSEANELWARCQTATWHDNLIIKF